MHRMAVFLCYYIAQTYRHITKCISSATKCNATFRNFRIP